MLAWAKSQGRQVELKKRLFALNFTEQNDPGDHGKLVEAAEEAGLDPGQARAVLASDRYADEVRAAEKLWQSRGISGVPAVVINDRFLISGGQPAEEFERQLRNIARQV